MTHEKASTTVPGTVEEVEKPSAPGEPERANIKAGVTGAICGDVAFAPNGRHHVGGVMLLKPPPG